MSKVTKLNLDDAAVRPTRRLHLRDIQDDNPEPRGSCGAQMHAARLGMGEDVGTVASKLRIRRQHLEAIEGGDFEVLPGRAYSIGFVRSYAEYLGLDEVEMVARFKEEFDAAQTDDSALNFPVAEEESRLPRGAVIVILVLVAAALYGVWSLTVSVDRIVEERAAATPSVVPATRVTTPASGAANGAVSLPEQQASVDRTLPAGTPPAAGDSVNQDGDASGTLPGGADPVGDADVAALDSVSTTEPTEDVAGDGASDTVDQAPAATAPAGVDGEDQISPLETGPERAWEGFVYGQQNHGSRIFIRANAQTWVRVEDAEGNVLLSRTLRAGESYRAPNRAGMVLATRNAGALQLYIDGKSAGTAGKAGEVLADLPLDPATLSGQ
jgi:cytoskeleton protein RodZ